MTTIEHEVPREATRSRLIEVAVDALERGGEQSVRIRDIAAELGVSVGAIYHHFPGREGLIVAARVAVFREMLRPDVQTLQAIVDNSTTVAEFRRAMSALTHAAQSEERAPRRLRRAEVVGVARHQPDLAAALAEEQQHCTDDMANAFAIAQAKGFVRPGLDPLALATFAQAMVLGLVLNDINVSNPVDPAAWQALADDIIDVWLTPDA